VICSDKTGTLTENRMTVQALWSPALPEPVSVDDDRSCDVVDELRWCLLAGANCNDSRVASNGDGVGDPTETAMLAVATRYGMPAHGLPREDTLPFSSERQYMATLHVDPQTGRRLLLVKGGVERVLDLCSRQVGPGGSTTPLDADAVLRTADAQASEGLRVLATAALPDAWPRALAEVAAGSTRALTFTGLQAMLDPPRGTAAEAVRTCRTAGLSVKMVTGDHAATAREIAHRIGLFDPAAQVDDGMVLTGTQLELLDDDELPDAVERATVFARVTPEQKLRLVEALQSRNHVVAMTGDGVNDAPALKQADIGVAMGLGGTEVAKEAGDMVLTDDDFATIEAAVEEGRGVFDNLIKFIVWTLPTNTAEAMVILVAIVLGTTLPILPTQILWINMTTAVLLGLTLAWEPKEPGIMERPPRDPRMSLMTRALVFRTLLVSALLVAGAAWVFQYEQGTGASVDASRTAALNVFVVAQTFYLFSCRSLNGPVWRIGWFSNRMLLLGVALQALGQLAITYLPVMNRLFETAPIDGGTWLRILMVALAATLVASVDKHRLRDRSL
jgi:cation-transporting ATPase F